MSNTCHITIYLCGSNAAIESAENTLRKIFPHSWMQADDKETIRTTRRRSPQYEWRTCPLCYRYDLWYPWGPPGEKLDNMAAAHPNVIMAIMYEEMGMGFRGQVFYVNGKQAAAHHGGYGPDGHQFYDAFCPLQDFTTTMDYYIYTTSWSGKQAAFEEAESV